MGLATAFSLIVLLDGGWWNKLYEVDNYLLRPWLSKNQILWETEHFWGSQRQQQQQKLLWFWFNFWSKHNIYSYLGIFRWYSIFIGEWQDTRDI